jgi:hypothetical protein
MDNGNEPVRRSKRTKNFTIVGNDVIQDNRITIEARGVLIFILSLPEDWVVRKKDLQNRLKISRRTIDRCFDEMKQFGYMCETDLIKKDGKFDGKGYIVYDYSILKTPPLMYSTDAHSEHRNELADVHSEHRTDAHGEHLLKKEDIQQRNKNNPPLSPKGESVNIDYKGLDAAVNDWLEYKEKEKKQKYKGPKSVQAMINSLYQMSNGNPDKAMAIVQFSMGNNYAGLIDPTQSKYKSASTSQQSINSPVKHKVEYYNNRWPDNVKICTEEQFEQIRQGNPEESFVVVRKFKY